MKPIILFGNGQTAQVAWALFGKQVAGFTVDRAYLQSSTFMNLPIIAFEEIEQKFPPSDFSMHISIAYQQMNKLRQEKYTQAKQKGYELASYISPKAIIDQTATIGDNAMILEFNNIQPFVNIGNNCVLWSGNHIGHHTKIGNHCFISSHVVISGSVKVGNNCFFGVNSTIRDNTIISERTLIGAGALILHGTRPGEVYVGNQSKTIPKSSEEVKI